MPRTIFVWVSQHFAIVLAAIFIFCAPNVDFTGVLSWHDQQRSLQIVVLAASLLCLIFGTSHQLSDLQKALWGGQLILAAVAFFFLLGATSSAMAISPRWAFLEWSLILALLVFTLQIAAAINKSDPESVDRFLLWSFFATATAYCVKSMMLYVVMLFAVPMYGMPFHMNELFSGFSNPRFFGQFSVMVLPFLVLPALLASSRTHRFALGCVPVFWWMLVIASGSRGVWVAVILGASLAFICARPVTTRWLRWQGACALAGAALYAMMFKLVPALMSKSVVGILVDRTEGWTTLSQRDVLWAQAARMIGDHPWFGVGPMHFSWYPNGIGAHPHNAILQIIAEWGIPAALLLFVVLTWGAIAWLRHVGMVVKNQPESPRSMVCLALLAALTGAAAHSLVDGVIVMPVSQMTLALICGWSWGMALAERPVSPVLSVTRSSWGIRLIAGMAIFAIVHGVYPFAGNIFNHEQAYLDAHPNTALFPRFWVQGWINQ